MFLAHQVRGGNCSQHSQRERSGRRSDDGASPLGGWGWEVVGVWKGVGVDEQALGTRANGGHFMHLSVSIGHGQAALAPYRAALPYNWLLGPPTLFLDMSCSPLHSAYFFKFFL